MIRHDGLRALCACFKDPLQRERERIRAEMAEIYGLFGLLMKQRNGARLATNERRLGVHELRRVVALCPYLVALVAPGSFVLIPLWRGGLTDDDEHAARFSGNLLDPLSDSPGLSEPTRAQR